MTGVAPDIGVRRLMWRSRCAPDDVSRWREPPRKVEVTAQGAAATPDLPFFDRGTWEQLIEVAPSSR